MKKIVLLSVLILSSLFIGGCAIMYYEPEPTPMEVAQAKHDAWKAEQAAQNKKLLEYTQSEAYKKKYSGTSQGNSLPGAKANSIVGTAADPLKDVRNMSISPSSTTYRIDVRNGSSFSNSSTQTYEVKVKK